MGYTLGIRLLSWGMWLVSRFHPKTRLGYEGRKQSLTLLTQSLRPGSKRIWLHAASLGEYEQGLPVLQALQRKYPEAQIIVSFFSPSGYEVVRERKTDFILIYLPLDLPVKMQELVEVLQPSEFYLVKYDFWLNLLLALKQKKVPVYVLSALLHPGQPFFKPWGGYFRKVVGRSVTWFFHQTQESLDRARALGWQNGSISGDTRYDRVRDLRDSAQPTELMENLKAFDRLIVFGSCWEGEVRAAELLAENYRLVLAPHEMSQVKTLLQKFPKARVWSQWQGEDFRVLIVDSVGQLSRLYRYAWVAVVGGGFHSKGLHNILEAAVYGVPVLFGSQYQNHPEADALLAAGGGQSFAQPSALAQYLLELDPADRDTMAQRASEHIQSQPRAVVHIVNQVENFLKKS